jgi:hypothetical protein
MTTYHASPCSSPKRNCIIKIKCGKVFAKNCNGNTSRPNREGSAKAKPSFLSREGGPKALSEAFLSYREIGPSALAKEIGTLRVLDIEIKITSLQFVLVILETSQLKRMLGDIRIVA